jgi:hypothetical protein
MATLPRMAISPISASIKNDIAAFIKSNANAMANDTSGAGGSDALAHAIAYGIAKAFASNGFLTAFAACIIPPGGGPLTPPPVPIVAASSTEA